ncbi:MAG: hypothetical protein J0L80_02340 [Chitinophagales bacterium]|nr:hypothetical protein [Chitinophagales bacterium]
MLLACIVIGNQVFAQNLEQYFYTKGINSLCEAAHPTNDYIDGAYAIKDGYIDISITSKDNTFGKVITTDLRIVRGVGDLYFSDIINKQDNDIVPPFEAFGLQANLLLVLTKSIDQASYQKIRASVQEEFGTDFERWTGKMWAVFALNLDYYEFMLNNKTIRR